MSRFGPLRISPDEVRVHFGAGTAIRGLDYARQGRVALEGWSPNELVLTGICQGSGHNAYFVTATFTTTGTNRTLSSTSCTCPVGIRCKHGVALLLTASEDDDAGSSSGPPTITRLPLRWRNVLGSFLSEPDDATPAAERAPIGLLVELPTSTPYNPGPAPTLRLITTNKKGGWVRTGINWALLQPNRNTYLSPTSNPRTLDRFDPEHLRAVRNIARADPDPHARDAISLAAAPADIWELLRAAADAGVTLLPRPDGEISSIELISGSRMAFRVYHDSSNVVVEPYIHLDGDHEVSGVVGLIGAPLPHGLFTITDNTLLLGPFQSPPSREALESVIAQGPLTIPDADVDEFTSEVLPALAESAPVTVDDDALQPPTIDGPTPMLTVHIDGETSRVSWTISYRINNRLRDFPPHSDPTSPAYRDRELEGNAWQRFRPEMETVARQCRRWSEQAIRYSAQGVVGYRDSDAQPAFGAQPDHAIGHASTELLTRVYTYELTDTAVLCAEIVPMLRAAGIEVRIVGDPPDYVPAAADPVIEIAPEGPQVDKDWLDLSVTIDVAGYAVRLSDVFRELAKGATHMLLPNGTYFPLTTPELLRLAELIDEAQQLGEIERGMARRNSSNASLWDELLSLGIVDQQLAHWKSRVHRLASAAAPEPVDPPATLQADLRDYQRVGFTWLAFCQRNEIGGILADDMGLGKTVQTLALFAHVIAEDPSARFLVVAPTSVVNNWITEARRFVPTLDAVAITTTSAKAKVPVAERIGDARLVVTSYTLLRLEFESWQRFQWSTAIFDEAQFVKNHHGKTHQCARQLAATTKFAITGTPMENNLMELWALLSITSPGMFPSPTTFGEYFRKPIEKGDPERLELLRRRIRPVMLRRTKDQVARDLPPKQEQVLSLELTPKHEKAYQTRLTRERQKVLGLLGDWEENRMAIFRSLTMMRQLSLHAGLVDDADLDIASSKIDYLAEKLPELIAEGHSALVFSTFTGFLRLIAERLDQIGLTHSYLDGSMSAARRRAVIADFTGGTTQVFLISLKAGGFGLNLTEADYCFVCDPWWNPAAEAQAVDRAHRIGQTRPVTVYRLVSAGTMEEKVVELQERKRALFTSVMDEGDVFGGSIGADDIRQLFGGQT